MTTTSYTQIILEASEGMKLCDREAKLIGSKVYLGKEDTPDRFEEITDAEAEQLQKQWEAEAEQEGLNNG